MVFSDAIYGKAPRYVSRERLKLMLDHEYDLLLTRLAGTGRHHDLFVFADTVATGNHKGATMPHGWMGIRFQTAPKADRARSCCMSAWDRDLVLQQQASASSALT